MDPLRRAHLERHPLQTISSNFRSIAARRHATISSATCTPHVYAIPRWIIHVAEEKVGVCRNHRERWRNVHAGYIRRPSQYQPRDLEMRYLAVEPSRRIVHDAVRRRGGVRRGSWISHVTADASAAASTATSAATSAAAAAATAVSAADPNDIVIAPVHPAARQTSSVALSRARSTKTILTGRSLAHFRSSAIQRASLLPRTPARFSWITWDHSWRSAWWWPSNVARPIAAASPQSHHARSCSRARRSMDRAALA